MATRVSHLRRWIWAAVAICLAAGVGVVLTTSLQQDQALTAARRAMEARQFTDALEMLNEAATVNPASAEGAFLKARCYRKRSQAKEFRQALSLAANFGFPQAALEREQTLMLAQQGRLSVTSPEVVDLLANPGDDTLEIYEALVLGCLRSRHLDEAELFLDGWHADFPDDPLPSFYRGLIAADRREWSAAVPAFEEAIAKGHPSADPCRHLGDALRQLHRYTEAMAAYRDCPQETIDVLTGQAACLEALRDLSAARETYERILQMHPGEPAALAGLGRMEMKLGDDTLAVTHLEQSLRQAPSNVQAWHALAWSLVNLGQTDRAREAFREAVRLTGQIQRTEHLQRRCQEDPTNLRFRLELADIFLKEGRTVDAQQWLLSVLQVEPDNLAAREALERIAATRGGRDEPADGPARFSTAF